jgi:hypothetical protein
MKNADELVFNSINKNITEHIHSFLLTKMKTCLDRYACFCRLEGGDDSRLYKSLKRELMDVVYDGEIEIFESLKKLQVVDYCMCGSDVRSGYNNNCSICHGSGYVYTENFKNWINK